MHASSDPVNPRAATPRPRLSPWEFTQRVASGVIQHQCMGSSAQIAYYLLFAMFPFLLSLASLLAPADPESRELAAEPVRGGRARSRPRVDPGLHRARGDAPSSRALHGEHRGLDLGGCQRGRGDHPGLHRVQGLYEDRPFWKLRILSLLLAVGVSFFAVLGLLGLWFGALVSRWWEVRGGLGPLPVEVWQFLRWPLVVLMLIVAIDQLYFLGPAARPRLRWITPGAVVAVVGWVVASLGFSSYVSNFGRYNVMYGGIGAVLILLTWMYLTSFFILLGAEINAVSGESHALTDR
jgi:membrane protein